MKIYTKTGDDGSTGLFGGDRVSKAHPRIEACGAVDELNAALGLALTADLEQGVRDVLLQVQSALFTIGAELASPPPAAQKLAQRNVGITKEDITGLEQAIDRVEAALPTLKQFILPGGSKSAALLHQARAVCRRAERCVVALHRDQPVDEGILIYLNRLSDLLFTVARDANRRAGIADIPWQPNKPSAGGSPWLYARSLAWESQFYAKRHDPFPVRCWRRRNLNSY